MGAWEEDEIEKKIRKYWGLSQIQVLTGKVKLWCFKDKSVVFKEGAATPETWAPEGTPEFLCGDTQLALINSGNINVYKW